MSYVYTVLGTIASIVTFEIWKNYALGDKVKDFGLWVWSKIKSVF